MSDLNKEAKPVENDHVGTKLIIQGLAKRLADLMMMVPSFLNEQDRLDRETLIISTRRSLFEMLGKLAAMEGEPYTIEVASGSYTSSGELVEKRVEKHAAWFGMGELPETIERGEPSIGDCPQCGEDSYYVNDEPGDSDALCNNSHRWNEVSGEVY